MRMGSVFFLESWFFPRFFSSRFSFFAVSAGLLVRDQSKSGSNDLQSHFMTVCVLKRVKQNLNRTNLIPSCELVWGRMLNCRDIRDVIISWMPCVISQLLIVSLHPLTLSLRHITNNSSSSNKRATTLVTHFLYGHKSCWEDVHECRWPDHP